jgi:tRNA A37 threonylcarbamoyladenosine dehydratase
VVPVQRFFTARTADEILAEPYDVVLDCIDRLSNKVHLIASCVAAKKRIVTVGSAGDRMDPTMVRVCDLARTQYDNLLAVVRKRLRQRHGFSRSERARFGVPCVYIPLQKEERPDSSEFAAPVVCAEPLTGEGRRSCNDGLGTAGFVTGAMGFVAAAEVIKVITADR